MKVYKFKQVSKLNHALEMKPLEMIIRMLTWLSVYPPDKNTSKSRKIEYICVAVVIMTVLIFGFIGFAAFFCKYVSTDMEMALMAVMTICTSVGTSYTLAISFLTRSKMKSIFENLSEIYDASKAIFFFVVKNTKISSMIV